MPGSPTLQTKDVRAAIKKARKLVGMIQATMGLEGAALDKQVLKALRKETTYELLGITK